MYSLAFNRKEIRHKRVRKFCCLSWQTCKVSDTTQAVCLAVSVISALGSVFAVLESGKRSCWPQVPSRRARLPERLCFIHLIRTPCALEKLWSPHTHHTSFHASNGSISPNIKLLWFFFSLWRFSFYFRHVPGCRLSFFSPYCTQMVVADLTLEERTCLNLLFSSCMLGDLGLARWSPPLLFSPFPPPSARITCGTEDRQTCQNVITYENKSVLLQFKTDAC